MTGEQAEEYARGVQHATQVSLQEFWQRAQAAAVAAATAAAERAGAGTPGHGTQLANVPSSRSSSTQASEMVARPMQPPPPAPPLSARGLRPESTPASTPRTPLTALEDWNPPSTYSTGTATTSSEAVVFGPDLPLSAMDASTTTAGGIMTTEEPGARDEPRETVGETHAPGDADIGSMQTGPLNPQHWMPLLSGTTARHQAAQHEVLSRWTGPEHWEGWEEWQADQMRPRSQAEAQQEAEEQQQRQERRDREWQEWVNRNRNFDRWYPHTSVWRGKAWTFHEHGKGGRSGEERQEEGQYYHTQSF